MGRRRSVDEHAVVVAAATAFTDLGDEATAVDDLLQATGLQRGSLYQAFGSKRGLFLATLRAHLPAPGGPGSAACSGPPWTPTLPPGPRACATPAWRYPASGPARLPDGADALVMSMTESERTN